MINLPRLFAAAAELFDVSDGAIVSTKRGNDRLSQARQACAYVLRTRQYTVVEIGTMLRRDHSTICYSLAQARRRLSDDPTFAARVRALAASIESHAPPTIAETVAERRAATVITAPLRAALAFWGVARPRVA